MSEGLEAPALFGTEGVAEGEVVQTPVTVAGKLSCCL